MLEEWKSIAGFDGLYYISNMGRFMSMVNPNKPTILKPMIAGKRYLYVHLWKGHKKYNLKIHKLVATTFVPYPAISDAPLEIDHIDRNRFNNRADNLRWVTRQENLLNR